MWKNNTLYFSSNMNANDFNNLSNDKKLNAFLKRIKETYLDTAEQIDKLKEEKFGFASILLSCSAIEAVAKVIYYNDNIRTTARFNKFCIERLNITEDILDKIKLYGAYRCGLAHEGRIKKRYAVTYEDIGNSYWIGELNRRPFVLINPEIFRIKYLKHLDKFFDDKNLYGEIVSKIFED